MDNGGMHDRFLPYALALTVKKETKSLKWTFAAFIVPTLAGFVICTAIAGISALL